MYKDISQEKFWAGNAASYWAVLEAQAKTEELLSKKNFESADSMKAYIDEIAGPVMDLQGDIAVINIKGSLVNGSAGFSRLWGVLGYDDIREAVTAAVAEKHAKGILLHIDSGGGQVAGCQDLGNYIMEVGKIKPVDTFTPNYMGSAAYWLGCCGNNLKAAPTAVVGSIGVLIVHQEISKMLEEQGVTTTVVRSGKYKAIANRFEPLSDDAKEQLQSQVDAIDKIFVGHVAARRGVSAETARKNMGQGQEFLGEQAKDAGLVDSIGTLSDAHSQLDRAVNDPKRARKPVAGSRAAADTASHVSVGSEMKVNLTQEQLAALANGASVESLGLSEADTKAVKAMLSATDEDAEAAAAEEAAAQAAQAAAQAAATAPKAGNEQALRAELSETQLKLARAQVKIEGLEEAAAKQAEAISSMQSIARTAIGGMQVALLGTDASAAVADSNLVAEHARLSVLFKEKFKAGRVSSAAKTEETAKAAVNPLFLAALAAQVTK